MKKPVAINKDIMDWEVFPQYDIIWTDPPWEDRMVKWFQQKNQKETGVLVRHTIHEILNKLAYLSSVTKPIVIEYSVKCHELVLDVMAEHGHVLNDVSYRKQSNGRDFVILSFNAKIDIPQSKGMSIVSDFFKANSYGTCFDPFAGIGATAKEVLKSNTKYIGSELNAKRFERLQKIEV